jgi:hypothetical protein
LPANEVSVGDLWGVWVLRLWAGHALSSWDEVLPVGARELPEDLRRIDALLGDPGLLAPIAAPWAAEAQRSVSRPVEN